jgi:hypothetical protein
MLKSQCLHRASGCGSPEGIMGGGYVWKTNRKEEYTEEEEEEEEEKGVLLFIYIQWK